MRLFTIAFLIAGAAIVALVASGFVPPPREAPVYSQQEIEEFNAHMLDLTWDAMELEGIATRPPNPTGAPSAANDTNFAACFQSSEMSMANFTIDLHVGYYLGIEEDTAAVRVAYFECLSKIVLNPSGLRFSEEQLRYFRDYYEGWLVPCFMAQDIELEPAPTWNEFTQEFGFWNPYYTDGAPVEGESFDRLVRVCGPSMAEFPIGYDDGTGSRID